MTYLENNRGGSTFCYTPISIVNIWYQDYGKILNARVAWGVVASGVFIWIFESNVHVVWVRVSNEKIIHTRKAMACFVMFLKHQLEWQE